MEITSLLKYLLDSEQQQCEQTVSVVQADLQPFYGHIPIIPLLNYMVKKFGSLNMTMLYQNLCYNMVCLLL